MRPLAILTALSVALAPAARADCARDAMLVLDGSASMAEITFDTGADTRIVEARRALSRAMPLVEPFRRIGLLTYGPGADDPCAGIALAFGPRDRAADAVIAGAEALAPAGLTPLAAAVERAAEVLAFRTTPAVVVLVTDGNETCGGRPCALSERLSAEAADLTVHVIAFRASRDAFAWDNPEQRIHAGDTVAKCLSDRTGGLFVGADDVDALVAALQRTLGCPLTGRVNGPDQVSGG